MKINANGTEISVMKLGQQFENNYISLTDLARRKNPYEPKDVVKNWLRLRSTIEFLGLWEQLNNPNFKGVEFDTFKNEAGANSFTLTPQRWIEKTGAIGMISKSGICKRLLDESITIYQGKSMSANVESMFYVRETPWHGLGTRVLTAPTSKEALEAAGLNWLVVQEPIRVVCNNTLNLALNTAKRFWSMIHTGDVKEKMEEARNTIFMAENYMDAYIDGTVYRCK